MKIEVVKEKCLACNLEKKDASKLAKKIINQIDKKQRKSIIEIFLVSKKKIRQINRDFRQVDEVTDSLSFPIKSFAPAKENILGTIFISPEIAKERGENCSSLLTHGILHLLGFDHEKNLKKWQAAEDKIMKNSSDNPAKRDVCPTTPTSVGLRRRIPIKAPGKGKYEL